MPEIAELPSLTTSADQFKRNLRQHGLAFQADFLGKSELAALRDRVLEQAEMELEQGVANTSVTGNASDLQFSGMMEGRSARFQAVQFLPNKGRVFLDIMQDARILDYCRDIFSAVPFYLAGQSATIVRKGASGQVIHTDLQAWPFVPPVPVMVNVAIALSDFTPEMGSTRFVPGSCGSMPPRIGVDEATGLVTNLDPVEAIACDVKAGSLVMWDGRLWHGQGPSVSDRERIAVIMSYVTHMVRPQDDYVSLLHDDVLAGLTETERSLLGFEVHFEYAGRTAPRNPTDTRANTNFIYPFVPELKRGGTARAVPRPGMHVGHAKEQAKII